MTKLDAKIPPRLCVSASLREQNPSAQPADTAGRPTTLDIAPPDGVASSPSRHLGGTPMGRGFVLSCAALLAALTLSACNSRSEEFRYRLTVEVETPQGLRTGSSVIEVELTETGDGAWKLPQASGVRATLRGEAVAVDLPGGKVMFALLRTPQNADGAKWIAYSAVRTPEFEGEYAGVRRTEYMKDHELSGTLPRDGYPMLVTFGDLADPTTVELVDPDNLAATFGEGVSLKRITAQITDDPVTSGIEERLAWLPSTQGAITKIPLQEYPPTGTPLPLYGTLTEMDFQRDGY